MSRWSAAAALHTSSCSQQAGPFDSSAAAVRQCTSHAGYGTSVVPLMAHMAPKGPHGLTTGRICPHSTCYVHVSQSVGGAGAGEWQQFVPLAARQWLSSPVTLVPLTAHHYLQSTVSHCDPCMPQVLQWLCIRPCQHLWKTCSNICLNHSAPPSWSCAQWHQPSRHCRSLRGLSGTAQASPSDQTRR